MILKIQRPVICLLEQTINFNIPETIPEDMTLDDWIDIQLQCGIYDVLEEEAFYETIDYLDESYKIVNTNPK